MNDAGRIVITAFISPFIADREMARGIIGSDQFREVFVSTALEVCQSRDPKGLYVKARAGRVPEFIRISSPYEAPGNPDLVIDMGHLEVGDALLQLAKLVRRG